MRALFFRKGHRRSDGEGHPFAFFVVGALVVLAVVFVIGLQVGRGIEKRAAPPAGRGEEALPPAGSANEDAVPRDDIRRDMDAFAEEAARVPAVAPQTARDALAETEKSMTFPKTLEGNAAGPVPIATPGQGGRRAVKDKGPGRATPGKRFAVQAGSFRDRKAAEALRGKLAGGGIRAGVRETRDKSGKRLYRVVTGPFSDRDEAKRTVRRLKERMKIDAIIVPG